MPGFTEHQSRTNTKILLCGESKAGKTTALTSLVQAGYKLRVLDFDNLLDPLIQRIKKVCPDKLEGHDFRSLRDKMKASPAGPVIDGQPKAFVEALKMLDRWKYDDIDLGIPAQWGPNCILVIDTLTSMADAAWDWALPLVPTGKSGDKDGRAIYGHAQKAVENVLAGITAETFNSNVIVISHLRVQTMPDGRVRQWPTAVGQALGPVIPRYFPIFVLCEREGDKRTIRTAGSITTDLAAPAVLGPTLSGETGLAEIFKANRS